MKPQGSTREDLVEACSGGQGQLAPVKKWEVGDQEDRDVKWILEDDVKTGMENLAGEQVWCPEEVLFWEM